MYAYIVREPFGGFAKGEVLSHAQIADYEAKGGHVDHHAIRILRPDPAPAVKPADEPEPPEAA